MDNKIEHHICPHCGWGSAYVVCKHCGTEYAPVVEKTEVAVDVPSEPVKKTDDMSWFVF